MPLHCFINMPVIIEPSKIEADIKEIIHNKFNDLLNINYNIKNCDWLIKFNDIHKFNICFKTPKQLDFPHPDNLWDYWAQIVIEDELALKHNAQMKDEEYPQQDFKPEPEQHKTFVKYLERILSHHSPQWREALIKIELSYLPEKLRKL